MKVLLIIATLLTLVSCASKKQVVKNDCAIDTYSHNFETNTTSYTCLNQTVVYVELN